jgi:hypothetical protein
VTTNIPEGQHDDDQPANQADHQADRQADHWGQDEPDRTTPLPQGFGVEGAATPAAATPAAAPAHRPTGPHLPAILLGLACLVIAGLAIGQELGGFSVDWGNVGPLGIVAVGAVLVVFGLVGLFGSRRTGD